MYILSTAICLLKKAFLVFSKLVHICGSLSRLNTFYVRLPRWGVIKTYCFNYTKLEIFIWLVDAKLLPDVVRVKIVLKRRREVAGVLVICAEYQQ